jgi:dipeptidase E
MRLYLSSYGLGDKTDQLLALLGDGRKTAVIANATDNADEKTQAVKINKELDQLEALGLRPVQIDLRDYFDKASELQEKLTEFDLIWVRGGNAFLLRKAMKRSGFDRVTTRLLNEDKLVYAGYSAGVVVLAPTLEGLELVDDPNVQVESYPREVTWAGLGVINYSIAPHYKSDHPESPAVDNVVKYYEEHDMPFKTLRDGEVIIVNDWEISNK